MQTEIKIIANLNDEQLDVLIQEIKSTAEMMDVKLEVESNELNQHDVSNQRNLLLTYVHFIHQKHHDGAYTHEEFIEMFLNQ
jgi:hypothetical protein